MLFIVENVSSYLQVRIVSKGNGDPRSVISHCWSAKYTQRALIMRNTYSQTQSRDTRNAGGIRGFLEADN